ncbi:MAG: NAD(P)/FAD-dependent oxidoreductase [Halieaceae bacterium]|nr:NAD(P)/FAD-dependent oxidoreductase [Halieaceae bacterium]
MRPASEPITESDEFIEQALRHAGIPALMMSMIHMSGDNSLLEGKIRPNTAILGEIQGFLPMEQRDEVRRQALEIIKRYRDSGCRMAPLPDKSTIRRMMSFVVGEEVPEEYVPLMLEEMNLDGVDSRSFHWRGQVAKQQRQQFQVVVIGAGVGGILAGIRLHQAGIGFRIFEKNPDLGGTWYENTYPGARVDTPNYFYCYSFEPNHDWSQYYSTQPELQAYLRRCADRYHVSPHLQLNTTVVAASYDESQQLWRVTTRQSDGTEEVVLANAVISAVGQLNQPRIPDFPGRERFRGPQFHSARFQHQHPLGGRRVAVVGSGASAFQLVPAIVDQAEKLKVFQRSPVWMFPNPEYHTVVPDAVKWLLKHLPCYARWYRFLLFWPGSDGLLPSLVMDPEWPHPERAVCELNDFARINMTQWIESQIHDNPALRDKVVPSYPPFVKRMLQDNGSWLTALQKDNAELITEGITEITERGILCGDTLHEVDIIIYATGFDNHNWLYPLKVSGREGRVLAREWGDEPKANLGITVPGFPNFFCIYGPATNLAHAGSLVFNSECQVRYIMGCLEKLLADGRQTIECTEAANEDYNRRLQDWVSQLVWSHPGTGSWYKNSKGQVTSNLPWRLVDYWKWTREPDFSQYQLR